MGLSSPGQDVRRMSTLMAFLWLLLLQLALSVTAESDHKARRKVSL